MKIYLMLMLSGGLLATTLLRPVLADCEHCDDRDKVAVVFGTPSAGGLLVDGVDGFEKPIVGVTSEDEILYNIPADGSEPVPLRQVPTLYFTEGEEPVVIDEVISPDNPNRGIVFPGTPDPITLGDWITGDHSKLKIKVLENGMSKTKMKLKGLLPNSLFTVWQYNRSDGPKPTLVGPFGGLPNVFITDHKGKAEMKRMVPFDMLDVVDFLLVIVHTDHRVYGGTFSLASSGNDVHSQLKFTIPEPE